MAKYRPGTANDNVINLFEKGKDPIEKLWISVLGSYGRCIKRNKYS